MTIKSFVVMVIAIAIAGVLPSHAQTKKKQSAGKGRKPQAAAAVIGGEVAPLNILSRQQWDANDPVSMMTPHRPKFITIHHTAAKQNRNKTLRDKMQALQKFSQNEGTIGSGKKKPVWADVPYHFYIAVDGKIAEGRNIGFIGDTNTEYDTSGHILVTLEGNFEEEEPTPEQMEAARELIVFLAQKYRVVPDQIKTHKDYAPTACPGKKLTSRLAELRRAVKTSGQP